MWSGKYEAAATRFRRALELDSNFYIAHWLLGWNALQAGKPTEAIPELEKAQVTDAPAFISATLGYAYAKGGQRDKAETILTRLNEAAEHRFVSPFCAALVYLGLGDKERALDGLNQTYATRGQLIVGLNIDRIYDPLRTDPRFITLLKKLNLER